MTKYGVLGEKLPHSFSPQIHKLLGNDDYGIIEVEKDKLDEFMQRRRFNAINVTIPYKTAVLPYLSEISDKARKIGCVNTVVKAADGSLRGYNTDYEGFKYMLRRAGIEVEGRKCLILGTGGTSLTAFAVLKDLGASAVLKVSREKNIESSVIGYDELGLHSDTQIIVNTTPVGMYPNNGVSPVGLEHFPLLEGVADVIYNPFKTRLIQDAEKLGIKTTGGLSMLVAQAKYAADLFFDRHTEDAVIEEVYSQIKSDMGNIVLIGMPGCGKTTLGRLLSERVGKTFVDTDQIVEALEGQSIPEIFAVHGEKYFRDLETDACRIAGAMRSHIIAAGGGAVLRNQNADALKQSATVIYIRRDIGRLATKGRPLSKDREALYNMFMDRKEKYEQAADFVVDNDSSLEDCVDRIMEIYYEAVGNKRT